VEKDGTPPSTSLRAGFGRPRALETLAHSAIYLYTFDDTVDGNFLDVTRAAELEGDHTGGHHPHQSQQSLARGIGGEDRSSQHNSGLRWPDLGDLTMKIHFLGTGAAEGIPAIGCDCAHCTRARNEGGKLVRERNAILFSLPDYELLVDCAPDIRSLINKYQVTKLDGILATRSRYDHIGGIKEFEWWPGQLDFLAEDTLFETIKREHWTESLDTVMFRLGHLSSYPCFANQSRRTVPGGTGGQSRRILAQHAFRVQSGC